MHLTGGKCSSTCSLYKALNKMIMMVILYFLEVGPHPVLKNSIMECLQQKNSNGIEVQTLNMREPEILTFYESLAQLYTLGIDINWNHFSNGGKIIPLPRYPGKMKIPWNETKVSYDDSHGLSGHPFFNKIIPSPLTAYEVELNDYLLPF